MDIAEVRKKYPQYSDMSDGDLAASLHSKFYADLPKEQFYAKIGYKEPGFLDKAKSVALSAVRGFNSGGDAIEELIGKAIPAVAEVRRVDEQKVADARKAAGFQGMDMSRLAGTLVSPASIASAGAFPAAAGAGLAGAAIRGVGQGAIFGALQPTDGKGDYVEDKLKAIGYSAAGGGAGNLLGSLIGRWIASGTAATQAAKAANATQDAAGVAARAAGYTIPPVTTNPTMFNRLAEGLAGKLTTAQQASIKNQSVSNALVRKALGMADDAPITKEALATLRKDSGAAYEAIASMPTPFVPDGKFAAAVGKINQQQQGVAAQFPSMANKEVQSLLDDLAAKEFDPRATIEAMKSLRFDASQNLGSRDPIKVAFGRVQKETAKELEELVARNLKAQGMDDLFSAFQNARMQIAKVRTVEKSINETTGNVIAPKLARQLERGAPLSGDLKTVAEAARAFPKATREVAESMPGISPLDYGVGAGLGVATGSPVAMALPFLRPAARAAILSPAYQRMFGAPSYAPGLLSAFGGPLTPQLGAALSAGGLLNYAGQ